MTRLLSFVMALLPCSVVLSGQELGMFSSWTIDNTSGDVAMYAATSADYNTAYYYQTAVEIWLDLPASNSYVCQTGGGNENGDSEASCTYTVSPGQDVEFESFFELDATYYYNELFPDCGYECNGWADYYGYSLLSPQDGTYDDNQTFFAPGTSVDSPLPRTKTGHITRPGHVGGCQYPTGDSTYSSGWSPLQQYVAQFLQAPDGGQFNQRIIQENLSSAQADSCWDSSMGFSPMGVPPFGEWLVGYIKAADGSFLYAQQGYWGYDNVGLYDYGSSPSPGTRALAYIQALQSNGQGSCGLIVNQNMYMTCGSSGGQYYVLGSPLSIYFAAGAGASSMTSSRGGVSQTRSIP